MTRSVLQFIGFAVLAIAGIAVWFGMAPASNDFDASGYDADLEVARLLNKSNEDLAESAPQQQVTNGWVARDLLEIQIEQLSEIGTFAATRDDRTPALILLVLLAMCWYAVITQFGTAAERAPTATHHDPNPSALESQEASATPI